MSGHYQAVRLFKTQHDYPTLQVGEFNGASRDSSEIANS
jgi:hypothetical protein